MTNKLIKRKIKKNKENKITKRFKSKGGKGMVLEMIRKENEELINRGRKEGIKQTTIKLIIEMLKNNANEEFIKKVTKVTNKELEEIKRKKDSQAKKQA